MESITKNKYPCPCCGYLVFEKMVGSDEICPICFWQDDVIDLEEMYRSIGPNKVSLFEAQKNYLTFGASEERLQKNVRKLEGEDVRDSLWRPLNKEIDVPKQIPQNSTVPQEIYYWYWTLVK